MIVISMSRPLHTFATGAWSPARRMAVIHPDDERAPLHLVFKAMAAKMGSMRVRSVAGHSEVTVCHCTVTVGPGSSSLPTAYGLPE